MSDFSTTYFQPTGRDAGDDMIALCVNGDSEMFIISAERSACRHKVEAIPTLETNKVIVIVSKTWMEGKMAQATTDDEVEQVVAYVMARAMAKGVEALALAGSETL